MKLYVMSNGLADDFPREAMASTGAPLDPSDCVTIPTPTYLIEYGNGLILYDTGWTGRMPLTFPYSDDDVVTSTLARIGVAPEQVDTLILSHLHIDHAGHIEPFSSAEVIVSKVEYDSVMSAYAAGDLPGTYIKADVEAWISAGDGIRWKFVDSEYEILDFVPGVKLVTLGSGHAYGMIALLLELEHTGNVLIVSDAIYGALNAGPPVLPPGVIFDPDGWRKSFDFLMDVASRTGAQLWYGHDLAQFSSLTLAEDGYYD